MQRRLAGRLAAGVLVALMVATGANGIAVAAPSEPGSPPGAPACSATAPTKACVQSTSAWDANRSLDPSARLPMHTPAATPAADPNGGTLALHADTEVETPQGPALTAVLPGQGGDYIRLHSLGAVARSAADGRAMWQRTTESLYADWRVKFQPDGDLVHTPQVVFGDDPVDPFFITTGSEYETANTHPVATGYLAGDRTPDVAIAEAVGINLGGTYCGSCDWPFDVPGSDLHLGTFVAVLDGRTGRTVYSELDPGIVTQLAITDGTLVVGDETGDPTQRDQDGQWGSATSVHALSFRHTHDDLAARTAWTWSTGAPWARLMELVPTSDGVALSWSDTPIGLGDPGPADGHVVLLDQRGHARWDVRTPGYPVLMTYDPYRALLAVVDETDPTRSIGYALEGLRLHDGRSVTSVSVSDVEPTTLTIGDIGGHGSSWVVGGATTTPDQVDPPFWIFSGGVVTAVDPGAQRVVWSSTLDSQSDHPPFPGSLIVPDSGRDRRVIVADNPLWTGPMTPTPDQPIERENELEALSGRTGIAEWKRHGDDIDPISMHADNGGADIVGVTDDYTALTYDSATGSVRRRAPILAGALTAIRHDVNGDGVLDLVVGTQSGGVFALDGRDQKRELWQTDVGGAAHQIALAQPAHGAPDLVVAATSHVDVLTLRTGRIQVARAYPGQYVWSVAVGRLGTHPAGVVVATDHLEAFDAGTGNRLWTYQPPVASYFSNAALTDGYVVAEYQNKAAFQQAPTTMAAVGIDGGSGAVAWSAPADPSTTTRAMLWNGVIASPDIPGAGATGVALIWQDNNYDGRIEVRDARTGLLHYTNISSDADYHQGWAVDPQLGLVSVGPVGVVVVRPDGPVEVGSAGGTAGAFLRAGDGPVLLTADSTVSAYPGSVLNTSGNAGSALAIYGGLFSGRLAPTDGNRVIATGYDQLAYDVVGLGETSGDGPSTRRPNVAYEDGVAVLSATGTAAATTAPARRAPAATPARPATLVVGAGAPDRGVATPQLALKVHGYTSSGKPMLSQAAPTPYDPALVRTYLGLSGDGSGQTVAVVDAFEDPNITADVGHFSAQFGLPRVCGTPDATSDCFDLTVSTAPGAATDSGWGLETSLDVEWIHAMAPKAAIQLVEAHDSSFAALYSAVDRAAALHPDAVSMSWGYGAGEFSDEAYYDHHCALADSVCVVSTGDAGHPGEYPAYNPNTLAVGGTTLNLGSDGTVSGETAWSGSGGGQSRFEPQSAAQQHVVPGSTRGIPDISFDADPSTGVAVYDSLPYQGQSGWWQVGGTSVGAPVWSAVLADTDQLRAAAGRDRLTSNEAEVARAIYASTASFGDITSGPANGICPAMCTAAPGYDFVTGLGSPRSGIDATLAAVR